MGYDYDHQGEQSRCHLSYANFGVFGLLSKEKSDLVIIFVMLLTIFVIKYINVSVPPRPLTSAGLIFPLDDLREQHSAISNKKQSRKRGKNRKIAVDKSGKNSASGSDKREIGKMFVSNKEIDGGSNGTVVYEGEYDGRPAAIKRIVKAHNIVASKEYRNLIASDNHPNIVRYYGMVFDSDFVYIALERCMCSLDDLIKVCRDSSPTLVSIKAQISTSMNNAKLDSLKRIVKDIKLWKDNRPSPLLLKILRDMVLGLAHLHEKKILHRDLKPENILILREKQLSAKISDMGISKLLEEGKLSFGSNPTGQGTVGWKAPEEIMKKPLSEAVDVFCLGLVFYYCITKGEHPFGDEPYECESNIRHMKKSRINNLKYLPEVYDLLKQLLKPDPNLRPVPRDILHHPIFWNSEMRLSFLRDASDMVKAKNQKKKSNMLRALNRVPTQVPDGSNSAAPLQWDNKIDIAFLNHIRVNCYHFSSTRHLLRLIRNTSNHYGDQPEHIQKLLGSFPDGLNDYFASRFPQFFIEVYKVMLKHCKGEACFSRYFN